MGTEGSRDLTVERLKNFFSGSVLTVALFVVWHIAIKTGAIDSGLVPSPADTLRSLWENASNPDYWQRTLLLTVRRGVSGFAASAAAGIFTGVSLATYLRSMKTYLMPILQFFEKLNPIALFPLFMLFFGIGDESKIAIVFWVAVWQIAFHTLAGIENTDKTVIKGAKAMGTGKREMLFKVILPASLPEVYNGLKLGVQISFLFVIAVEMLSSSNLFPGLGGFIMESKKAYSLPNIYSGILFAAIIGMTLTKILDLIGEKLFSWKEKIPVV
jgi:NitT/TauT family transport system permease protein